MTSNVPAGYNYGDPALPSSPVTLNDLDLLQQTVLWSETDRAALRRAGQILGDRAEALLDVWYGFVGSHPHLVAAFAGADGAPDAHYLGAVRGRFAKWIVDVCEREWDQAWLDHQNELAHRHHSSGKNRTDHIASTSAEVPLRYLVAFIVPITATVRGILADGATSPEDLNEMHDAWFKAVTLTVVLWAQPYTTSW